MSRLRRSRSKRSRSTVLVRQAGPSARAPVRRVRLRAGGAPDRELAGIAGRSSGASGRGYLRAPTAPHRADPGRRACGHRARARPGRRAPLRDGADPVHRASKPELPGRLMTGAWVRAPAAHRVAAHSRPRNNSSAWLPGSRWGRRPQQNRNRGFYAAAVRVARDGEQPRRIIAVQHDRGFSRGAGPRRRTCRPRHRVDRQRPARP